MKSEKLLETIGNIDDKLIDEAVPGKRIVKKQINWTLYGTLAACLCLCVLNIWMFQTLILTNTDKESASFEANAEAEKAEMEEAAVEEEALAEEEVVEEEAPAEESGNEPIADIGSIDIAYGFVLNGRNYYPISFEERKLYGLIPEDAKGLTPENTYNITSKDLGDILGTVEYSENESLIGATVYHYVKFPESDDICIIEANNSYEFYVSSF